MAPSKKRKVIYILITAACCVAIILLTRYSERSDILRGVGSDGIYYAKFTPDLLEQFKNKTFMSQPVDRLLPLFLAHIFYSSFFKAGDRLMTFTIDGSTLTLSQNVVEAYAYLNALYLMFAVIMWAVINYRQQVSLNSFVVSMVLMLFNFMFLKQFFFEPVFLDQFVFLYSILVLYAVLFKKEWLQLLLLAGALFVNRLAAVVTVLMVLLNDGDKALLKMKIKRNLLLALWLAGYLGMTVYLKLHPLCTELTENNTIYSLWPLSVVFVIAYTFYLWLRTIPEEVTFNLSGKASKFTALFGGIGVYLLIVRIFTVEKAVPMCGNLEQSMINEVLNFIRQANSRPLGFLSSHYDYLGLPVICVLLFSERIASFLKSNPGWIFLFFCFFLASHSSESRYLTFFIPFLVWMLVSPAIGGEPVFKSRIFIGIAAVAGLLWSGFYRKLNPLGTELYYSAEDVIYPNLFVEPLQNYFRHFGTTTNNDSYHFQLTILAVSLLAGYLFILFFRKKKKGEVHETGLV